MVHDAGTGPLSQVEFLVPSMVCDRCAEKIRRALTAIPGVQTVKPKLWQKRVRVRYESTKVRDSQIKDALVAAGFSAVEA